MNTSRIYALAFQQRRELSESDRGQKRLALVTALECNYNYSKANAEAFIESDRCAH